MTENIFASADPDTLRNNAERGLKETIESFDKYEIDALPMIMSCWNIWDNMNSNPVLKSRIDAEIEKRSQAVGEITQKDKSHQETIADRYNPHLWLKNIPPEMANDKYTYLRDKANSLLNLIEAIK